MADDRTYELEGQVEALAGRLEDFENQAEALAALPERVADMRDALNDIRTALHDFRDDCRNRLDALTKQTPNGYVPKAGKLDVTTWISIAALVVVPIVVAVITSR